VRFQLPAQGVLHANDANDPLPYYYHRWIGWAYRHRLQLGLDLLPSGGRRVLEVGVGSGILVPTLTSQYAEYTGTDLTLPDGLQTLAHPNCKAEFRRADLLKDDDLPSDSYDAIVCFSVLEHIEDSRGAARNLARALAPGGTLVAGYPMVNIMMGRAFAMIGFRQIEIHHVSPPAKITAALGEVLTPVTRATFPPAFPPSLALYQCTAWTKRPAAAQTGS
jgi:SAM-dependent methyltransferase